MIITHFVAQGDYRLHITGVAKCFVRGRTCERSTVSSLRRDTHTAVWYSGIPDTARTCYEKHPPPPRLFPIQNVLLNKEALLSWRHILG